MGRLLATLATILILLLLAAIAVPAFVDWNDYRSSIENTASAMLGRRVDILGDIDIVLLPEPHVRARNVAAGAARDGLSFTAEAVDISLSLPGLLSGRAEANRLKLVRPILTLDFSKPSDEPDIAGKDGPLRFTAGVKNADIENGRISVYSKSGGATEALALTGIGGTVSAQPPGNGFRFTGHFLHNGRQYDAKLLGAPADGNAIKLAGSASDTVSKISLQADGLLNAGEEPGFEGALTLNVPQGAGSANRLPFDIQLKSAAAKIGFSDAALQDLVLTLDPQNRAQILTGTADLDIGAKSAAIALQARSLDADALLAASAGQGIGASAPADWSGLKTAANTLLWLYPDFALNLTLEGGMVQLKGEPIENVKVHGSRAGRRWAFEEALAKLPGDTAVRLAGVLSGAEGASQLTSTVALEGKNLGRLARWLIPPGPGRKRVPGGAFSVQASLVLSGEATAFEGVKGSLDGTPFTASLRLDKVPERKLQLALAGENFDLTAFETGEEHADALSPDSLKTAWQGGLAQIAAMLGGDPKGFDTADVDISAGSIKTGAAEAKKVAVHVKFDRDVIAVSKLNAETPAGLVLQGEGSVPLRGTGQGRFDGRLEARLPQAIVQLAALAGYDRASAERRAAALSPAVLSVKAETGAGTARAELEGNLGSARVKGDAQLAGSLSEWRKGQLSASLKISETDGNKLLMLLFPSAVLDPGASISPGALSSSVNGVAEKLEAAVNLTTGPLRVRFDGQAGLMDRSLSFEGKTDASSQTPGQFIPGALLTLLGGEPKANLHVSANVAMARDRFEAQNLLAETPRNLVSGNLAIDAPGGVTRIGANLTAEHASLPSLLGFFLSGKPGGAPVLKVPATLNATPPPADLWSGQPFSLTAFQETEGKLSLSAKALDTGGTLVVSEAQLTAKLEKGALTIESLSGKTLGGALTASLSLAANRGLVAANAHIALYGANLSLVSNPGTPPIATGGASLTLEAFGQGLSPLGLISELTGKGKIQLSAGRLAKLSPEEVRATAEELLGSQQGVTEDVIRAKVLDAAQSKDFEFRGTAVPLTIQNGILEIPKTTLFGNGAAVHLEGLLDLSKMQADTSWELEQTAGGRSMPVKINVSGPLRELGAMQRSLAAEDFVRAIQFHKLAGEVSRLESLDKPASAWPPARIEPAPMPAPQKTRRRRRDRDKVDAPTAVPPAPAPERSFEQRIHDAVDNAGGGAAAR